MLCEAPVCWLEYTTQLRNSKVIALTLFGGTLGFKWDVSCWQFFGNRGRQKNLGVSFLSHTQNGVNKKMFTHKKTQNGVNYCWIFIDQVNLWPKWSSKWSSTFLIVQQNVTSSSSISLLYYNCEIWLIPSLK